MGLVRGEDVILSMYTQTATGFEYVPFGCARSVTFDISTDFIETSVTESGSFKTFIPSGKQYSGNIEGLVFLDKPLENETKATTTLDLTDIADSGVFPTTGNLYAIISVSDIDLLFINLFFTSGGTFATFADFLIYMNNGINASIYGYTSVISGNTLIISARPGLGASMNGRASRCRYEIDGPPSIDINSTFAGGVDGYYPAKISMGFLYNKFIVGESIQIQYFETDDNNNYLYKVCIVYIESINETSSFDNIATFTASFKGNGAPNIDYGEI